MLVPLKTYQKLGFVTSIALGIVAVLAYAIFGFAMWQIVMLLISMFGLVLSFIPNQTLSTIHIKKFLPDVIILILLLAVLVPVYLWNLHDLPYQVNTDEVTIGLYIRQGDTMAGLDWLGLSPYFGFPWLVFIIFGKIAQTLGGLDFYHLRLVHALSGLVISGLAYLYYRVNFTRFIALLGALWLSTNHSLLAISRMAMRDNTGLLLGLVALGAGIFGMTRRLRVWLAVSGVFSALCFYTYYPSRILPFIFIGSVFAYQLFKKPDTWRVFIKLVSVWLVSFMLVVLPVVIATIKSPTDWASYQRQQFLWTQEGRQLEQVWTRAKSGVVAWQINIKQGLLTFNKPLSDQGFIYPNPGHGFVDPLTGALLWLGVAGLVVKLGRKNISLFEWVSLSGFIGLYLVFTFLITKAPNYTRLLIFLPFVVILAIEGIKTVWDALFVLLPKRLNVGLKVEKFWKVSVLVVLVGVMFWNGTIFTDFIMLGKKNGNDVGAIGRYLETNKDSSKIYIVADADYPFYSWGSANQWQAWAQFFIKDDRQVSVVSTNNLRELPITSPTVILTRGVVWNKEKENFLTKFSVNRVVGLKPDDSILAVELIPAN